MGGGRIIEKILTGVCEGMGGGHMLSSSIRSREGGLMTSLRVNMQRDGVLRKDELMPGLE